MPDDNGIRTALAESSERAARDAQLPAAAEMRRRAHTRSVVATSAAAVLTVLAVSATVLGVSQFGAGNTALPASAPPTPSSSATGTRPVPTTIPADFDLGPTLPADGEYSVTMRRDLPTGICTSYMLPGVEKATAQTYRQVVGPEYANTLGVAVFADADAAMSFMTGLQTAAGECARGVALYGGGVREVVQEPLRGSWASGLTTLLIDVPDGEEPKRVTGSYLFAMRVGSAVALRYEVGEILLHTRPYAIESRYVDGGRDALEGLAPRMCLWTVAGC